MAKRERPAKPHPRRGLSPFSRACLHLSALVVLCTACTLGLRAMKQYVDRTQLREVGPPTVVLSNRPPWMSDFLAESIASSIRPPGGRSALDERVLVDTANSLRSDPWIAKVNTVRRAFGHAPGDTLVIDCGYRTPLALVHWGAYYWLVDEFGVKLPEQFAAAEVPKVVLTPDNRTSIRMIEGVKSPPPEAGCPWPGTDIAAGLELCRLLFQPTWAQDVVKVDVTNDHGRHDAREAWICLVTKRASEIRWGRPASADDAFIEVPAAQKLDVLAKLYAGSFGEAGQVAMRQPWIDVRFDKPVYPDAAAIQASNETAKIDTH